MKSKKGQLGMDVAKMFVLGLMTLLIVGVTTLIILNSLNDTSLALEDVSVSGESGYINSTGYTLAGASDEGFTSLSISSIVNASDGVTITSGNYTVSDAGVVTNATATTWDSVNISYSYKRYNSVNDVVNNGSSGITDFFSNTTTWLALLGVVIIILIIAVVINVVNRFGGSAKIGSGRGATF